MEIFIFVPASICYLQPPHEKEMEKRIKEKKEEKKTYGNSISYLTISEEAAQHENGQNLLIILMPGWREGGISSASLCFCRVPSLRSDAEAFTWLCLCTAGSSETSANNDC